MMLQKRKTIRLKGYDYAACGAYFITICVKDRQPILSEIGRGGALLRPLGVLCQAELLQLQTRYPVSMDQFVIMPNHLHAILRLGEAHVNGGRAEQSPAPTVGDMVCALKSITTKIANRRDGSPGQQLWQRSYHDHIIRDEQEYREIWQYIDTNPLRWEQDCFFTGPSHPETTHAIYTTGKDSLWKTPNV